MSTPARIATRPQRRPQRPPAPKLGGKRERTRKKILEAAFRLIGNEHGLSVRIEEICAAAHISRGTFYNYFTGLEQLFEVLAIELSHDLNGALVAGYDESQSHAEGANAAIQHYLNYARRDPAWAWAMVHLSAFGPTFGSEAWEACHGAIEKGIKAGELRLTLFEINVLHDTVWLDRLPCPPRIVSKTARHSRRRGGCR